MTVAIAPELVSPYDRTALEKLCREHQVDLDVARRLRNDLLKRFRPLDEIINQHLIAKGIALHSLELHLRCDSATDGATKLLLKTGAGMLIETVILRVASGRTALCLSSQVGCAAACDFCATGKMGIARNLTSTEILDQMLIAGQMLASENRVVRNIVFMGMGEPFHNQANLFEAIETLTAPDMFHHSPSKILVSTVGIPDGMVSLAERFPKVNQALSLHSARQEVRESLIPLARTHSLSALRSAVQTVNQITGRSVMIEYLMLAGRNDSPSDADELMNWVRGLNVHVNLIPYNPIDESPHLHGSDRETCETFATALKRAGIKTTLRYSLGRDISAACGQLVRHENRLKAISARRLSEEELSR